MMGYAPSLAEMTPAKGRQRKESKSGDKGTAMSGDGVPKLSAPRRVNIAPQKTHSDASIRSSASSLKPSQFASSLPRAADPSSSD